MLLLTKVLVSTVTSMSAVASLSTVTARGAIAAAVASSVSASARHLIFRNSFLRFAPFSVNFVIPVATNRLHHAVALERHEAETLVVACSFVDRSVDCFDFAVF